MKGLMLTMVIFSCFLMSCQHDIYVPEPDCVCSNLNDYDGISKSFGDQEGTIGTGATWMITITPKTNFQGNRTPYGVCTDSFMLKQIAFKNIKDSDQVILKGVRSYPDGTCNVHLYRTSIKNYNSGSGYALPMIRAADIEKK